MYNVTLCYNSWECHMLAPSLHWLLTSQRIKFKVAVLTYKIRSSSRPAYLHSLLSNHISESMMTLRSTSRPLIHVPRTRTVYGSCAFSVAAPSLWNSLPADITNTTSLTLETASKHFYFIKPPMTAQLTSPAVKRLWIFGLYGTI